MATAKEVARIIAWLRSAVANFDHYATHCRKKHVWQRGVIDQKSFGSITLTVSDIPTNRRAVSKGTQTVPRNSLRLSCSTLSASTCATLLTAIEPFIKDTSLKETRKIRGEMVDFTCTIKVKNF